MVFSRATYNFVSSEEVERFGLKLELRQRTLKTMNFVARPILREAKGVVIQIGSWAGTINFSVVPLYDFKVILGMEFHREYKAGKTNVVVDALIRKVKLVATQMRDDVEAYVKMCLIYQHDKKTNQKPTSLLEPLPIPERPWESLSIDFIVSLPKVDGRSSIIVVVDRFSKYATFIPTSKECLAERTVEFIMRNIVKH
ncbi:uncharacterized protein LOC116265814 [Nymphaea colorata]|uniref:uncharacterized protein LOC116265814 n=1 Tax=Nymphaea colorata TaxID=210225 RepID=UPI00129D8BA0|nr:uncharacterized protein LOC116265814 [Nymphaea colorata]